MSTLADAVTARYSPQRLIELTNPDNTEGATLDPQQLELAVTDATAEFSILVQATLDVTDANHLPVAVELVLLKLMEWGSVSGSTVSKKRDQVEAMAKRLSLVDTNARNRISPKTKSVLSPTSEQRVTGETVRPDFDLANFDDLIPGTTFTDDND